MKYMVLVAALGVFFCGNNLNAMNPLRNCCIGFGQFIENVNVPLIGKLTNIMPFGLVATCFKDCPGQTMIVLAGLLAYVLSRNEFIGQTFEKYKRIGFARCGIKEDNSVECDETLFVFDGEDEEDAEHEVEIEDELLGEDLKSVRPQQQSIIKFL